MKKALFSISSTFLCLLSATVIFAGATSEGAKSPASPLKITVDEKGFHPTSLTLHAKTPAKITFVRTSDKTCATAIEIPDYNIKRDLPLNKPVVVELTPSKTGEIGFICGMKMFKGKLVVSDK